MDAIDSDSRADTPASSGVIRAGTWSRLSTLVSNAIRVPCFAEEMDACQHVQLAAPRIARDLDGAEGTGLGMHVPAAHTNLGIGFGRVLGHPPGQRRDQNPRVGGGPGLLVAAGRLARYLARRSTCDATMLKAPARSFGLSTWMYIPTGCCGLKDVAVWVFASRLSNSASVPPFPVNPMV